MPDVAEAKPAFDPSKPFKPVDDKPAFDPSKPFKPAGQEMTTGPMTWGQAGISAIKNIPKSGNEFIDAVVHPILHPIETAKSMKDIGLGVMEKAGLSAGSGHEKYADAVGQFFKERYGSAEGIKRTIADDPVGVLADLSTIFSGGETALARVPGVVGKVGEVAGTLGRITDPVNIAAKTAGKVGEVAGKTVSSALGVTTGAGGESIRTAAKAGFEGGKSGEAFQENLRGVAPMEDAVADARGAVAQMRKERGQAYVDQMRNVKANTTILDFRKIDRAVADASGIKSFKGQDLSPTTAAIRKQLMDTIADWKKLSPMDFHTPEGIDALKQKIGNIRDSTQHGTPERLAADRVYTAIKQTIVKEVPEYAKVMKGYENASKQIKEIERELSVNPKASVSTALGKLQAVLKDNVSSRFGRRKELANFLINAGAPHLLEKLAGQSLKTLEPRGLARAATLAVESGLAGLGFGAAGGLGAVGLAAAGLLAMSPRLVGEAAYYGGKAAKGASKLPIKGAARAAFKSGRDYGGPLE